MKLVKPCKTGVNVFQHVPTGTPVTMTPSSQANTVGVPCVLASGGKGSRTCSSDEIAGVIRRSSECHIPRNSWASSHLFLDIANEVWKGRTLNTWNLPDSILGHTSKAQLPQRWTMSKETAADCRQGGENILVSSGRFGRLVGQIQSHFLPFFSHSPTLNAVGQWWVIAALGERWKRSSCQLQLPYGLQEMIHDQSISLAVAHTHFSATRNPRSHHSCGYLLNSSRFINKNHSKRPQPRL